MRALDLSQVGGLPVPVAVLRELRERAAALDVELLVIGAAARDMVVQAATQGQPARATLDVDVAVAVDRGGFEAFTRDLQRVRKSEHKFLLLGVEVDVVPFGPIEEDRSVVLNEGHRLDVTGVAEAARSAVTVDLPDGLKVKVASLPAQAALKVLAWRDRHRDNSKDGLDLRQILEAAAVDPYEADVWADTVALEHGDYDIRVAAAHHTGRLAAEPFDTESGNHVLAVLNDPELASRLANHMGSGISAELLMAFAAGFRAGLGVG